MSSISLIASSVSFCSSVRLRVCVVKAVVAVLLELLQRVHAVFAHMADGDPRLLGIFVRDLDHFLTPLGVELRNRDAQELTLHDRIEAEIGVADGAVDGVDRGPCPRPERRACAAPAR